MNVVRLMGGLGNQLFQYAFGQALAKHSGEITYYDATWYDKVRFPARPYLLDKFMLHVDFSTKKFKNFFKEGMGEGIEFLTDKKDSYFHGYWQNPHLYDEDLLMKFRYEFHIKPEYHTDVFLRQWIRIKKCNSIALHVRRGDYVGHPRHLVLPMHYYQTALMQMSEMKGDVEIFVFSDDVPWCQEHFDGVHIVEMNDFHSFELMRACKHFIISNSTFSWWPAFLSFNSTIIAPDQWAVDRRNGAVVHEKRMLLDNWLKISLQ